MDQMMIWDLVTWEEEVNGINTTLWYDKSFKITTEILDVFSNSIGKYKFKEVK